MNNLERQVNVIEVLRQERSKIIAYPGRVPLDAINKRILDELDKLTFLAETEEERKKVKDYQDKIRPTCESCFFVKV